MESTIRVKHEQRRLENKLDKKLGFYYWRTYWATSMWSNLSTPLNLGITIFTALMTAHSSSSSSFISDDLNMKINIATFFISIINTFFMPQKQFSDLNEYLSRWSDLGNQFEQVVYSDESPREKINQYREILDNANQLHKEQFSKHRNFVTDFLHILVRTVFMSSNDRWMSDGSFEFYEKIQSSGIELEFDYKKFKYSYKKAGVFERLCSCFSCCFKQQPLEDQPVTQHETATEEDFLKLQRGEGHIVHEANMSEIEMTQLHNTTSDAMSTPTETEQAIIGTVLHAERSREPSLVSVDNPLYTRSNPVKEVRISMTDT